MRSVRSAAAIATLWTLGASAVACSLLVPTGGLSDAKAPAPDGEALDTGAAVALVDAMVDSSDGSVAEGGLCSAGSKATFCDTFDLSPDAGFGWTGSIVTPGSTLELDPTGAVSAPSSLLAIMSAPVDDAGSPRSARLYRELPSVPATMHVEADVWLCDGTAGTHEFLKLEFPAAGIITPNPGYERASILLANNGNGTSEVDAFQNDNDGGITGQGYPLGASLPTGAWFHVALDVTLSAIGTGSIKLVVDRADTPVVDVSNVTTLTASASGARLVVGPISYTWDTKCADRFDNVLVEDSP